MVPARRHQRQVAPGPRRHDLGRVGRRGRRPRPGLRLPVALLADARRPARRPDRPGRRADPTQPRQPPPHRQRLERRRHPADGAGALPHDVPVLRRRGPAVLPALPAQRRRVPRRAVQHRVVRPAHPHGRPGDRARGRRLRAHARRRPPLLQPPRAGPAPAHPRAAAAADAHARPVASPSSTRSTSSTSRSRATTRTPASRPRLPSERTHRPGRRGRRQRRHRRGRRHPVAAPRGLQALQGAHPRPHAGHGPHDVRLDRPPAARPHHDRAHPRSRLVRRRRARRPRPRRGARARRRTCPAT